MKIYPDFYNFPSDIGRAYSQKNLNYKPRINQVLISYRDEFQWNFLWTFPDNEIPFYNIIY